MDTIKDVAGLCEEKPQQAPNQPLDLQYAIAFGVGTWLYMENLGTANPTIYEYIAGLTNSIAKLMLLYGRPVDAANLKEHTKNIFGVLTKQAAIESIQTIELLHTLRVFYAPQLRAMQQLSRCIVYDVLEHHATIKDFFTVSMHFANYIRNAFIIEIDADKAIEELAAITLFSDAMLQANLIPALHFMRLQIIDVYLLPPFELRDNMITIRLDSINVVDLNIFASCVRKVLSADFKNVEVHDLKADRMHYDILQVIVEELKDKPGKHFFIRFDIDVITKDSKELDTLCAMCAQLKQLVKFERKFVGNSHGKQIANLAECGVGLIKHYAMQRKVADQSFRAILNPAKVEQEDNLNKATLPSRHYYS